MLTPRISWRRITAASFFLTLILGAGSLMVTDPGRFLGADMSGVAAGVAGFYPGAAAKEVAKVFGFAWLLAWVVTAWLLPRSHKLRPGWRRLIVYPGAALVAHGFWMLATAMKYPALFEGSLARPLRWLVFRLSFDVPPGVFVALALVALAMPFWAVELKARRAKRFVATAGVASGLILLAAFSGNSAVGARPAKKPHVLFIAIDSLRADRLRDTRVMPHVGALLADPGVVSFEDHYVGVPRTFPSWVEMLEGRYAPRTGIRHMFPGFDRRQDEFVGLGTVLRDAGYRTRVVSDFAGDIFPRFAGGFEIIEAPKLNLQTMIRMSIDQLVPAYLPLVTSLPRVFPDLKESPAFADPAHLTDILLRRFDDGGDGSPVFMTAFYSTAHFPYAAPYPYYSLYARRDYRGDFFFQKNPEMASEPVASDPQEVAQVRALYDGSLRAIDDQLGRLFAALRKASLWDDTLIVLTADHGEDLFEPGMLQGHGEHLRGRHVLHVPWVMKLPASTGKPPARSFPYVTRSIDVASTIASAAGIQDSSIGEGVNLMPWVRGDRAGDPALPAYSETEIWFARTGAGFFQEKRLDYPGIAGLLSFDQGYTGEIVLNPLYEDVLVTAKHRMLIKGRHKIIYMPTPRGIEWELYDRVNDPDNRHDIIATSPVAAEMQRELFDFVGKIERSYRLSSGYVVPQ